MVIAEKPDAALHIAEALHERGSPRKMSYKGVPVYEAGRSSERILVCSALGHLYKVDQVEHTKRSEFPVWKYAWKPIHEAERGRGQQERWLNAIAEAAKEADVFVNACDYDVEGSLIGYMVLKYSCKGADASARRMKFSTLTHEELRHAYENTLPHLDFPLVNAGLCRHEVDWLYGINLSRALTESARKSSGSYATLSTGRVQGPTLRFVVEREEDVATFVPIPHWEIQAVVEINGERLPAQFEMERLDTRADAHRIAALANAKEGLVDEIESRASELAPPHPFDLSSLQSEAYRHFGMAPRSSLSIAERLYLDALISYPRTGSQKLPDSIGYRKVLESLSENPAYRQHATTLLKLPSLRPNEGNREDPAHPAVYPSGAPKKRTLDAKETKLYDLIVRRFLATFATPATRETVKARISVNGLTFYLRGSHISTKGWIDYYKPYARFEDIALPSIKKGDRAKFVSVSSVEKLSQPPPRYNPSSLLREMEKNEIGTKATRAEIIETLARRGYVKGEKMLATPLGIQVIDVLEEYCPRVLDVAFTRELEEMMADIELGKQEKEHVVNEAIDHLKPIIDELKAHEGPIGEQLSSMIRQTRSDRTILSVPCPKCGHKLNVVKNRKTGKRFIGCLGKWEASCDFALPLPQLGTLTLLDERCRRCGFQMVKVQSKGRRPLITCQMCYVEGTRHLTS